MNLNKPRRVIVYVVVVVFAAVAAAAADDDDVVVCVYMFIVIAVAFISIEQKIPPSHIYPELNIRLKIKLQPFTSPTRQIYQWTYVTSTAIRFVLVVIIENNANISSVHGRIKITSTENMKNNWSHTFTSVIIAHKCHLSSSNMIIWRPIDRTQR